jgi:hypothetical protein
VSLGAYSRYLGTSRLQYPSQQLIACNTSQQQSIMAGSYVPYTSADLINSKPLHLALRSQVPAVVSTPDNSYWSPKILTNVPQEDSLLQDENEMDIGTRINIPQSSVASKNTGTMWMPHRLALPNRLPSWQKESIQNLLTPEERSKIYDLSKRVINCEPTCPYSIVKNFADSQYENLMSGLRFFLFTR